MKKTIIICACLALAAGVHAQSGIEAILQQVEANNKELQANARTTEAQKLENRASNNLADPTLSYAHLWDSQDKNITVGELVIAQSFDFPSLYVSRARLNRLKANSLDAQANAQRQAILLQAQEACLDIIHLSRQQQLLDERLKNAEELAAYYRRRLETGDASTLETNKINLELLNVRTEARMNRTALDSKLKELTALNGNLSLVPGRPMPDGPAADAGVLVQGIADIVLVYPDHLELLDYKTDRRKTPADFVRAYRAQLELYAKAIEKRFAPRRVTYKGIYSLELGELIEV